MIGTIANTGAILLGSSLGSLLKKGVLAPYEKSLMQALGLVALSLGAFMTVEALGRNTLPLLFIVSMVAGALIGAILQLEERVERLRDRSPAAGNGGHWIEGLTTAVLLFCVGTLSILGPVESALKGNHTLLFTNAVLDGVTSLVLASTFGIGIILSAGVLFLWQGAIYLLALLAGDIIPPELMTQLSLIGGILILSTGLNILKIARIKTLNLLPALGVPILWFAGAALFS